VVINYLFQNILAEVISCLSSRCRGQPTWRGTIQTWIQFTWCGDRIFWYFHYN